MSSQPWTRGCCGKEGTLRISCILPTQASKCVGFDQNRRQDNVTAGPQQRRRVSVLRLRTGDLRSHGVYEYILSRERWYEVLYVFQRTSVVNLFLDQYCIDVHFHSTTCITIRRRSHFRIDVVWRMKSMFLRDSYTEASVFYMHASEVKSTLS
jgi:hypothetical protein